MEFEVNGRKVVQGAVRAMSVVEGFDVIENGGASLLAGEKLGAINQFEFQGAPETFHGSVVVTVAFATHGGD